MARSARPARRSPSSPLRCRQEAGAQERGRRAGEGNLCADRSWPPLAATRDRAADRPAQRREDQALGDGGSEMHALRGAEAVRSRSRRVDASARLASRGGRQPFSPRSPLAHGSHRDRVRDAATGCRRAGRAQAQGRGGVDQDSDRQVIGNGRKIHAGKRKAYRRFECGEGGSAPPLPNFPGRPAPRLILPHIAPEQVGDFAPALRLRLLR